MHSSALARAGTVVCTGAQAPSQQPRRASAASIATGGRGASTRCARLQVQHRAVRRVELQRGASVISRAVKAEFASFDDLLKNSEVPVLVDFYAVWCGPCQMISPVLADIQNTLKNSLKVVKINTEKYPDIASRFQISALPTLILFKNGVPVDRIEGMLSKPDLLVRLRYFLNQP